MTYRYEVRTVNSVVNEWDFSTHSFSSLINYPVNWEADQVVYVYDQKNPGVAQILRAQVELDEWIEARSRAIQWKPEQLKEGLNGMSAVDFQPQREKTINASGDNTDFNAINNTVNPAYYQSYFGGIGEMETLQWLEAQQYVKQFRTPEIFLAAVELQARKYLDRLGGKNNEPQEILKATWYLRFIAAYIVNGKKPIRVVDIPKLLGEVK